MSFLNCVLFLTYISDILKWFVIYSKHIRCTENSFNHWIPPTISKFLKIAVEIIYKALSVPANNVNISVCETPLYTFLNTFLLYHTV